MVFLSNSCQIKTSSFWPKKKKSEAIKVREGGGGCSGENEAVCLCGQFRGLDLHISVNKWSVSFLVSGVFVSDHVHGNCGYAHVN